MNIFLRTCLAAFLVFGILGATYGQKEEVGYLRLTAELGTNTPTGMGNSLTHVEASENTNFPSYFADTNDVRFVGKTITDVTGSNVLVSVHATQVGYYFYGAGVSLAPGAETIDMFHAGDWINDGFLRASPHPPRVESNLVQNHSWIGFLTGTGAVDKLNRLDLAIDRDGFTSVVALNNGSGTTIPPILASGYNSIAVGLTSGAHSSGQTLHNGVGRCKPDIVAPRIVTSLATPVVAGAASLLVDAADDAGFTEAANPQTMKAILMAGATKEEFPTWDRTHSRPIDEHYGVGELNIYQSYYALDSGQQAASETNHVPVRGWDYQSLNTGDVVRYYIDVPDDYFLHRLSFVATWHAIIEDTDPGTNITYTRTLNNVDAFFYTSSGLTPDVLTDWSTSQVDNVEHIYQPILPEGEYVVELTADGPADCGVAWFGTLAKVPVGENPSILTNGSIMVSALVSSNIPYQIDATTNLLDALSWEEIFSGSSTSGVLQFIDLDATNLMQRYYRFSAEP